MPPRIGEVWCWDDFYKDPDSGAPLPKFVVVLAFAASGDIVLRLLTSRETLRPQTACSHDSVRPGFFLGVIDPATRLNKPTWIDLRELDDVESEEWDELVADGTLTPVLQLGQAILCDALICAIGAPDTQRQQQNAMYTAREALGCC